MSRYFSRNDIGSNVYPAPGGVTYGSRWLGKGPSPRPIPEGYPMSYVTGKTILQHPSPSSSQRGGFPGQKILQQPSPSSSQRGGYPDNYNRPTDPYNDPYMDTYHPASYPNQQRAPQPLSETKPSNLGFGEVFADFSKDYSSAHGLPNIYKATTIVGRIFWTLLFIGGLAVSGWQFHSLITRFLEYHVATELSIESDANLTFPAVTVCNINKVRRSAILKSKHREVLFIDDQQPLPYYAPCIAGDFACSNGQLCIKPFLVCDGINHCTDFSDEAGCVYGQCGKEQFRCVKGGPLGYCIDKIYVCDRQHDCYEGYDEFDCVCKASEWKCSRLGGCIPRTARCDGQGHCLDKSDEEGCPKPDCSDGFWCYYSGECIHRSQVCDTYSDCSDKSDESQTACDQKKTYTDPVGAIDTSFCIEGPDYFNCGDGQCWPYYFLCDGAPDCANGGDESTAVCGDAVARCNADQFTCENGRQCVYQFQVCNISPDCDDNSDEQPCNCFVTGGRDETNILQTVFCLSGNHHILFNDAEPSVALGILAPALDTGKFLQCVGITMDSSVSPTSLYECNGNMFCLDGVTGFLETCVHVFSECYVSENGQDYKGKTFSANDGTPCSKWNTEFIQNLASQSPQLAQDPLLGSHPFCRNPGGLRDRPWCFIEGAASENDWKYCAIPTPSSSCLTAANSTILMQLMGGTSSEGRVEIIPPDGQRATINDKTWTLQDGNAVCRHLGFNSATAVYRNADKFGPGSGDVYFSTVQCSGNEQSLVDCILVAAENKVGNHDLDVGVSCTGTSGAGGGSEGGVAGAGAVRRSIQTPRHEPAKINSGKRGVKSDLQTSIDITEVDVDIDLEKLKATTKRRYAKIVGGHDHHTDVNRRRRYRRQNIIPVLDASKPMMSESFKCILGNQTIPWYQTCNNYPDCPDGSDEFICGPDNNLCPQSYRPCRFEDLCIMSKYECDGRKDCRRGLDEEFCQDIVCPKNYWKCNSSKLCIPEYAVCDTIPDCAREEDEQNCTNNVATNVNPLTSKDWIQRYANLINSADIATYVKTFANYYIQKTFDRVKGETPPDWKRFFTFSQQADYSDLTDVLKINRQEINKFGHQLKDMILECYFDEIECNLDRDFVASQTDEYGNCYTFNYRPPGREAEPIVSNRSGPKHGLSLVLNLEQGEYLSLYGQRAGARITISRPLARALPEEDGFMIRPGVETSVGLRLHEISRIEGAQYAGPEGACTTDNAESQDIVDGVAISVASGGYDRRVCLQTCLNTAILEQCRCSSTIELDGPRCKVTNTEQDICVEFITYLHQRDKLNCNCRYPCTDRFTTKTISQSVWPSDVYLKHLLRSVHADSNNTKNINEYATASKNLAKLNVFYEELNYQRTKEIPAYEPDSLFSDIGGTLGLYIGFSVLTAIEFGVLIFEICKHCGRNCRPSP